MATNLSFANSLYLQFLGTNASTEQRQALSQEIAAKKQENAAYTEFNATADFVNNRFDIKHSGNIAGFIIAYYDHFNPLNQPPSLSELLYWAEQENNLSNAEIEQLKGNIIYDVYAISLNNQPQPWEISSPMTTLSVNENEQIDYAVAITGNATQPIMFALAKGEDNDLFTIDTATGQLNFRALPNAEAKNNYNITVIATDTATAVDNFANLNIIVNDINEAPHYTGATTINVAENTDSPFYTMQAIDPEGDTLTFSINNLAEKNNALFSISNTGDLRFISPPDFESGNNSYLVDVTVTDGITPPVTQEVKINVTDVNEEERGGERKTPALSLTTMAGNNSLTVTEGGIADYKITLTAGHIIAGETLRFTVDALNGTGDFAAVNPDDFSNFIDLNTASYTFEKTFNEPISTGSTLLTFSLATTDDNLVENPEQFSIQLSQASIDNSLTVETNGSPLTTTIIDNDINQSPIAVDDLFVTQNNQLLTNTLASNDSLGNTPSVFSVLSPPTHGILTLNANGNFNYTPTLQFIGIDNFSYQITDSDGETSNADVAIEVMVNKIPLAVADSFSAIQNQAVTLSVASNDNLGDLPAIFNKTTNPKNGSLQLQNDGQFTYTPATDFVGTDSFTYQITDTNGETSITTATIEVLLPNNIPVATNDLFSSNTNQTIINNVASNDSLGDTPTLFSNITSPTYGSLLFNNDGSFTYTPNINYTGTDSFDYQITDSDGDIDTATASFTIILNNNTPSAIDDNFTASLGQIITSSVAQNDSLGDTPTIFTNITTPNNGSLIFNNDGTFTYTPNIGFSGTDSFDYQITDIDGETATASVMLNTLPGDNIPFAKNDTYEGLVANQILTASVATNDNLGDSPSTYTILSTPSNNTFIFNSDGSFSFSYDFISNSTTSFNYQITDADGDIDTGTATLTTNTSPTNPFTFTTNTDALVGDATDNNFIADNTLTQVTSPPDSADGLAGNDSLIMIVDSANDIVFPGTIQNIENVEIFGSGNNLFEDIDFTPLTSVSLITLADFYINGSRNRTLSLGNSQDLLLKNILEQSSDGGDILDIALPASRTSFNLTVNELGRIDHQPDINLEAPGLTSLNIITTGISSQFSLQQTGTILDTINISGNQDITLSFSFFNASESTNLSINTTGNSANTESAIRFNNHILNIIGGSGVEKFSIEDTDSFNGGAGTDIAQFDFNVSAANLLDADLINVERIFVDGFNANIFDFSAQTEALNIEVYFASGGNNEIGANIIGSSNNDIIRGSFNNDTFTGGAGADLFGLGFFNTAGVLTSDTITDFSTLQNDAIISDSAGYDQQSLSFPTNTNIIIGANPGTDDTFIADSGLMIIDNSSPNINNATSLTTNGVATYLNSFESSAGIDKLVYENTNSIFYVVVSNGIDTGIYEVNANGNNDLIIDTNELTLIGTLTGITNTGSLSTSFLDFQGNLL